MTAEEKNEISKETGIPISSMGIESKQHITYKERDKLMHFNTKAYWHCYYDPETKKLYNEYCRLIKDDAKSYLVSVGLLSEDNKQIESFEN